MAAKANDPALTVVLCLNHHHLNTIGQLDLGVARNRDPQRTDLQRLVSALRGHAAFFVEDARAMMARADELDALVHRLDTHYPGWREMPEE